MTHICDSRPVILKNDCTDDYSIIKTGFESCDCTLTNTRFICGCSLLVEIIEGVRSTDMIHCDAHEPIEALFKK